MAHLVELLDEKQSIIATTVASAQSTSTSTVDSVDLELAWELARRVEASDVSNETVSRIERSFDYLAVAYSTSPPAALLPQLRTYLAYVNSLMDKRSTIAEKQRLIVAGGWLSLLAATCHIDLQHQHSATEYPRTAASLARHAEHAEIRAWCYETQAWRVLTDGDYPRAIELSRAAQHHAPRGSSAAIQAAAQEGRAHARLGDTRQTTQAISTVHQLVTPLPARDVEHHYHYDPHKVIAYTATTLAWAGDPAAESHAREIIERLRPATPTDPARWPRRIASAHLDLAMALTTTGRFDEACHTATQAIESGRIVPSNIWRVTEIIRRIDALDIPEADTLRDAYRGLVSLTR
ncbi:transcriptional regulator [Actinokineospora cianjurensis]|uniref:transcriptional regulator n=1 Tax=Actinokineospora cianjurensis TaxID=585224 RepID=UPI000EB15B5E|nr:transcriptional regulator [Actinokineospora cianjurensis]